MNSIIIRDAVREDCTRLMELIKELAVYEREPDAVTVPQEHFEESGFGEQPVWWAIVAELDGIVVGFALYYIRYSTWKGHLYVLSCIEMLKVYRRYWSVLELLPLCLPTLPSGTSDTSVERSCRARAGLSNPATPPNSSAPTYVALTSSI